MNDIKLLVLYTPKILKNVQIVSLSRDFKFLSIAYYNNNKCTYTNAYSFSQKWGLKQWWLLFNVCRLTYYDFGVLFYHSFTLDKIIRISKHYLHVLGRWLACKYERVRVW